jgi:hypothetical protein
MICSPDNYTKHKSCFTKSQLLKFLSFIDKNNEYISFNKNKLWNIVNSHIHTTYACKHGDESCWVDKLYVNQNALIPKKPDTWKFNNKTWLTNFDILNVMSQYEKKYKSFKFIGVVPIDFKDSNGFGGCISQELCRFKLSNKYSKYAVVFNLSPHYDSGSHWIALFINTNKRTNNYGCFFFDSNADYIPDEVNDLCNNIISQVNDPKFTLHVNDSRKQFKDTECGMFCLNFIIKCLQKHKFDDIVKRKCFDDDVHKLRNVLFRN